MAGAGAPVLAGLASGVSLVIILSIAALNNPVPPDMILIVDGKQYKAGIGSYGAVHLNGERFEVDIEPTDTLPLSTINASRMSEIQFISKRPIELTIEYAALGDGNEQFDLGRVYESIFLVPRDVPFGDYVLTTKADWNYQLISYAYYHHKITISSNLNIPSPDEVSDIELINRTRELEEVAAILTIYDEPLINVDRTEDFGVEYNISRTQLEGMPYDESKVCLSVKILMDSDGHPESLLDAGGSKWELGDEIQIEFLKGGGVCVFTLISLIPDNAAISETNELEETQAFLAKYPRAKVNAYRDAVIEITYSVSKSDITGEPWNYPEVPESAAILRMQVDKDLEIRELHFECTIQIGTTGSAGVYEITEDIVGYLQKAGHCWDDESLIPQYLRTDGT